MQKLLEFQKRVTPIVKDSQNPFFHSKYFDINSLLETIRPILNELGLVIMQPLASINGKPALETNIFDAETGEALVSALTPLPENTDPQKMGATITYFRRYALQSALCLEADDDDAESAVRPAGLSQNWQKPTPPPAVGTTSATAAQPWKKWEQPAGGKELGTCPDCGAPQKMYANGKPGCSKLCWKPENAHLRNLPIIQTEEPPFPDEIDMSNVNF